MLSGLDVEFITKDDNQRQVRNLFLAIFRYTLIIFNEIRLKFEIDTESQNFGVYELEFKNCHLSCTRLFDKESLFNDILQIFKSKSNYKVKADVFCMIFAYYVENIKINLFQQNREDRDGSYFEDESLNTRFKGIIN